MISRHSCQIPIFFAIETLDMMTRKGGLKEIRQEDRKIPKKILSQKMKDHKDHTLS